MAHFYLDESLEEVRPGDIHALTGAEARHAATVARSRVGESVLIGNGRGLRAKATIHSREGDHLELVIDTTEMVPQRTPRLVLAQALAKSDRDERAVEASVEVGVDVVIPWQAERSVSRWDPVKAEKGRARWMSLTREACKQALAPWLPDVEPLQTARQLLARENSRLIVLDPSGVPVSSAPWRDWANSTEDIVLIVGPEGGLSPGEMTQFRSAGAHILALGPQVLRTSTAGPVALGIAATLMGAWG